eukprot:8405199-Karenia_brevis.AAC.1
MREEQGMKMLQKESDSWMKKNQDQGKCKGTCLEKIHQRSKERRKERTKRHQKARGEGPRRRRI